MSVDANKARSIFISAVENCAPDQWGKFLDHACGDDVELRRRVELLLAAHQGEDSFLDRGDDDEQADVTIDQPPLEQPGTQIGPYTLLEVIGQGGMGVVYRAEQRQPIERQVALKIIKPGMDTQQVIARFDAERQTLARMDHPHIAHVLDAGATDSGRPYFVMELVTGIPITEYCDQHGLSIPARLELFVSVCQAVQHAHQKGIIHRDLKPSNILVAEHEDTPLPKVIDFGVAKATGGRLTDKTAFTSLGQLVGTPLYMSPEQAGLSGQDVDTRTDVYALGVLLYELLTGEPPLDKQRFRDAAYEEIRRVIREEEPSKPSTRVSALGDAATTASGHRQVTPASLRRLLEGELDWIVMKALEKDRTRRYETASAYAKDIQRYLNDEPVEAGPPSVVYRFRKFAHRHKLAFLTTSLVAVSLLLGMAGTTWQSMRARSQAARAELGEQRAEREAKKARTEAAISQAVNDFLTEDLLAQADPENEPDRDIKLRTILDRASANLEGRFPDQPLVAAAIHMTLGMTYLSLGEYEKAERHVEKAHATRCLTLGREHPDTLWSMHNLAVVFGAQGRYDEAEKLSAEALEINRRVLGPEYPDTLTIMMALACWYNDQGRYNEAEKLHREVLEIRRRVLSPEDHYTLESMHNLAIVYCGQGRYDEAEKLHSEVLEIRRRVLGPEHVHTLISMMNLANVYRDQCHYAEAEKLQAEVLEIQRRVLGPEHPDTIRNLGNLAATYVSWHRFAEAEKLLNEVLEILRRVLGPEHPHTLASMNNLAATYEHQGRNVEAEKLHAEVLEIRRRTLGPEHPATLTSMMNLANRYLSQGRSSEAEKLHAEVLEIRRRVLGPEHPDTLRSMGSVANTYVGPHRYAEAEKLHHEALDIQRRVLGPEHPDTLKSTMNLALVYHDEGRYAEAEKLYHESLEIQRRVLGSEHRDTLQCMGNLGSLYIDQDRHADAERLYTELLEIQRRVLGPEHPDTLKVLANLAILYMESDRYDMAAKLYTEVIEIQRRTLGLEHLDTLGSMNNLAVLLLRQRRFDGAEKLLSEVLGIEPRVLGPEHPLTLASKQTLANVYDQQGRYAEVANIQRELLQIVEQLAAADARYRSGLPMTFNNLAWLLATCPDAQVRAPQEAVTLAAKAVELAPEQGGFWNTLGVARYRTEEWDAATQALHKSIELTSGGDASDFCFLAMAHWQLGNKDEARQWYDKAVAWIETHKPQNEDFQRFRAEAAQLLGIANQSAQQPDAKPAPDPGEAASTTGASSKPNEEQRNGEDKNQR